MNHEDWLALHEKVQAAKGSVGLTDALITELNQHTIDGVTIRRGLMVLDYNRDLTHVTGVQSVEINGTVWFATANGGMFDGSRMWSRERS